MHRCNTAIALFSLLISAASALACSSSEANSDSNVTAGAAALDLGAVAAMTDPDSCIITTSPGSVLADAASASSSSYRWRSYVSEQRILRDISVDANGAALPPGSTYSELDQAGRTLVVAVEQEGGELERSDFGRDRHGNIISYRQVLTTQRDLSRAPPEQPSVAYDFINHYSAAGLLEKHNRTDSSAGVAYRHDANGRCQMIVDDQRVERREYDASGRLSKQIAAPHAPDAPVQLDPAAWEQSSVTNRRYDEQGRPIAVEQDGGGPAALPSDGQPDILTLWSYADDGSWQIEYIDFTSEAPNDQLERGGALVPALHRRESWSAGCAALQGIVPTPVGDACTTD